MIYASVRSPTSAAKHWPVLVLLLKGELQARCARKFGRSRSFNPLCCNSGDVKGYDHANEHLVAIDPRRRLHVLARIAGAGGCLEAVAAGRFNDDFVTLTQCERRSDYRSFKSGPFGLIGVLSFAVVLDMPSAGLAENSI